MEEEFGERDQLSAAIHERKRLKKTDVYIDGEVQSRIKIIKGVSKRRPSVQQGLSISMSRCFCSLSMLQAE